MSPVLLVSASKPSPSGRTRMGWPRCASAQCCDILRARSERCTAARRPRPGTEELATPPAGADLGLPMEPVRLLSLRPVLWLTRPSTDVSEGAALSPSPSSVLSERRPSLPGFMTSSQPAPRLANPAGSSSRHDVCSDRGPRRLNSKGGLLNVFRKPGGNHVALARWALV